MSSVTLLVDGGRSAGKSALAERFLYDEFPKLHYEGCDRNEKKVTVSYPQTTTVLIYVYDPFHEEFIEMRKCARRRADAVMFVFDIMDRASFDVLETTVLKEFMAARDLEFDQSRAYILGCPTMLIAAKTDQIGPENPRVISHDEAVALAHMYGMVYYETSAKDAVNVTEAFQRLIEEYLEFVAASRFSSSRKSGKDRGCFINVVYQDHQIPILNVIINPIIAL